MEEEVLDIKNIVSNVITMFEWVELAAMKN
jgi:hypothetical protein